MSTPPTREPEVIAELRHELHLPFAITLRERILAAYDAVCSERDAWEREAVDGRAVLAHHREERDKARAERDAAVRELEETRKREALSDAIVDECDSDITKLVQERATLRARLAACEKIVEAAVGFVEAHEAFETAFSSTDDAWGKHMAAYHNAWNCARDSVYSAARDYRAAVAAETQATFVKITDDISGEMVRAYNVPHAETQGET